MNVEARSGASGQRLIDGYLSALANALTGAEDRDEVLSSVREHIAESLGPHVDHPDDATARRVLDELGPVEEIAALTTSAAAASATALPPAPSSSGGATWTLAVMVIVSVVNLGLAFIVPFLAAPIAVANSIVAFSFLRRSPRRPAAAAVLALSAVSLLTVVFISVFLLQARLEPAGPFNTPVMEEPG